MAGASKEPHPGDKPDSREGKIIALEDAIREVKIAAADRGDVVVELREAARARLELLVDALSETIASVPDHDDQFDFAISSGQNPRFFVDAVSHVDLGRDRMTYRFVRDTRQGRVVLAENRDIKTVAETITRYIAERVVERQRMMEGDVMPAVAAKSETDADDKANAAKPDDGISDFMLGLIWFLIGSVAGAGLLYLWFTQNLPAL